MTLFAFRQLGMYVPSTISEHAREHRTHRLKRIVPLSERDMRVDPK